MSADGHMPTWVAESSVLREAGLVAAARALGEHHRAAKRHQAELLTRAKRLMPSRYYMQHVRDFLGKLADGQLERVAEAVRAELDLRADERARRLAGARP